MLSALAPVGVQAHAISERAGDFYGGLLHPLTSLEHALAFVALGLLSAQRGVAHTQEMVLAFPASLMAGAALVLWMPDIPGIDLLNIASVVMFGLLVAVAQTLPLIVLYAFCLLFGLSHGYANGLAISGDISPWLFILGLGLGGLLVTTYSLFGGDYLLRRKEMWMSVAVRVAGSWIAAIGIIYFGIRGGNFSG